ncbi:MAG: Minf_1886 family protein [Phycisphaerae bacterium]
MTDDVQKPMEQIIAEDGRYPIQAYGFLHEAMSRTVEQVHGEDAGGMGARHVTGQDICRNIRDMALERWGMLARTVLRRWNVHGTIDFGNMVYLLIQHNHMKKTDEDSIEDFRNVYDLDDALKYEFDLDLKN